MAAQNTSSGMWVLVALACAPVALFMALAFAPTAFEAVHGVTLEQRWADMAAKEEVARKDEADACLSRKTPWRCLVDMSELDADDPAIRGTAKKSRASFVQANTNVSVALTFCREEGTVNCGERLVELGYSSDTVFAVLSKT